MTPHTYPSHSGLRGRTVGISMAFATVSCLSVADAFAHTVSVQDTPPEISSGWAGQPFLLLALLMLPALYLHGLRRLWRTGAGHGVTVTRAAGFAAGWLLLAAAIMGPLDAFGVWSLTVHMVQHMLLMTLAPPLLLIGLPYAVCLAGLPAQWARTLSRPLRSSYPRSLWLILTMPVVAATLQTIVTWSLHLPPAIEAALHNDVTHHAMHAAFLLAGLLFWTSLQRSSHSPRFGAAVVAVVIIGTMIQMGLLGALLTFAATPLYPTYLVRAQMLGIDALHDQQLAGLIMWIPATLPYVLGGIVLASLYLRREEHCNGRYSDNPRG